MAEPTEDERAARRAAVAAAFDEVTTGPRVRLTATIHIPEVLLQHVRSCASS